eukprot:11830683-Ditylum_brightwellii.AAC.1
MSMQFRVQLAHYLTQKQKSYNKNVEKVIRDGSAELAGAAMTQLIDVQGMEQATIEMEDDHVYPLQRVNDEHIMPCVIMSGKFKAKDIQRINYCQMYLNITTIANVTLANGKQLGPHMINGITSLYSSKSIHIKSTRLSLARPVGQNGKRLCNYGQLALIFESCS